MQKLTTSSQIFLNNLEEKHDEKKWSERFQLENDYRLDLLRDEIWDKIAKQLNNLEDMELSKFLNSCQNTIIQHLTSSKVKSHGFWQFKIYMLSFVLENLVSKEIISNKAIELIVGDIFESKNILDICNVTINQEKLKSLCIKPYLSIEKLNAYSEKIQCKISKDSISEVASSQPSTKDTETLSKETELTDEVNRELPSMEAYIFSKLLVKYEQGNYWNIK